jgi:hypothetical protein
VGGYVLLVVVLFVLGLVVVVVLVRMTARALHCT